jgi:adenylate cyclase
MPRNVEIKARISDRHLVEERAAALAAAEPHVFEQTDSFFTVPTGRLKLREFSDGKGELIFYDRPDAPGPATSEYILTEIADPTGVLGVLAAALPLRGRVHKRRTLYLVGRTRIHLDQVTGLGDFLELEVVLRPGEDAAAGEQEADRLMKELGVSEADLVDLAYIDLLGHID